MLFRGFSKQRGNFSVLKKGELPSPKDKTNSMSGTLLRRVKEARIRESIISNSFENQG